MADEPVSACASPSPGGARRWARAHRTAVAAAFVAGVVGLGRGGVQAWANNALRKANDATQQALGEAKEAKQATDAALAQSEESRRQAEAVSTFLVEAFRSPDPEYTGREVKVADLLDRASAQLDKEFAGSQATKVALLEALAMTYYGLGLFDEAVSLHTRERAEREAALGSDHPNVGGTLNNLASLYRAQGRYGEAEPLFKRSLTLLEKALGPDHPDTPKSRNHPLPPRRCRSDDGGDLSSGDAQRCSEELGSLTTDVQCRGTWPAACGRRAETTESVRDFRVGAQAVRARLGPDHPDTLITPVTRPAPTIAAAGCLGRSHSSSQRSSCARPNWAPTTPAHSSAVTTSQRSTSLLAAWPM
jgi:tetratricopeptide (TPR) repeat protein